MNNFLKYTIGLLIVGLGFQSIGLADSTIVSCQARGTDLNGALPLEGQLHIVNQDGFLYVWLVDQNGIENHLIRVKNTAEPSTRLGSKGVFYTDQVFSNDSTIMAIQLERRLLMKYSHSTLQFDRKKRSLTLVQDVYVPSLTDTPISSTAQTTLTCIQ